jgi:hypothetical protein
MLSLARTIGAEVIDDRGQVAVSTGDSILQGHLRDVPRLFVEGAQLGLTLLVDGDSFEAVCRVLDDEVAVEPGSRVKLEVLRATPAGISGIEPFDLIPLHPVNSGPVVPPFVSLPPQEAFDDEEEEPTGVLGTLKEMPITEIVQTLAQAHKDAVVEVKPKGGDPGTIAVEHGRVVFAETLKNVGEPAFFELMRAARGAFRIRYGRKAETKNINRDTTFLLLEGARLQDEINSGKVPSAVEFAAPQFAPQRKVSALDLAPPAFEFDENDATTITPADPWKVPPSSSGLFARFFDEAGVQTPPPMPVETMRFQSLHVPGLTDLDDEEVIDSDATTKERKTNIPSDA